MVHDESLANIKRTVDHLSSTDPEYATRPAVVAAPQWWVDLIRDYFKDQMETPEDVLDQVHGCKLVLKTDIDEPFTVAADGRIFPALPAWARRANKGETH